MEQDLASRREVRLEEPLTDRDVLRALELADEYLQGVENVLWETSSRAGSEDVVDALDTLTSDVWELQHSMEDLQDELERRLPALPMNDGSPE